MKKGAAERGGKVLLAVESNCTGDGDKGGLNKSLARLVD
jgi:hypothetical protein|tara:strand:+ start:1021 stop:1137 length:117 start_codon:yes stop_codon:yes gene_type:complete